MNIQSNKFIFLTAALIISFISYLLSFPGLLLYLFAASFLILAVIYFGELYVTIMNRDNLKFWKIYAVSAIIFAFTLIIVAGFQAFKLPETQFMLKIAGIVNGLFSIIALMVSMNKNVSFEHFLVTCLLPFSAFLS